MRIGIDCRFFGTKFTGIGRYVETLVRELERIDHDDEYVLFMNDPEYREYSPSNPRFEKRLVDIPHYSLREQVAFPWIIARERLDLMHYTHFNAPIFGRERAVVTIHDLTLSFYPGRRKTSWLHRWAYRLTISAITRRAKAIISITEHTKKDLNNILDVPTEKVSVIYHGIDVERFRERTDETKAQRLLDELGLKNPYYIYAGVQREHKNLHRLIEAYANILKKNPEHGPDLVLVGREDRHYHDLRNIVIRENLQKRVHFVGFRSDEELVTLYQRALAHVFPSLYEGFGLPVLEAMAAGIPVVCARSSCLPEVVGEGNALFFDPLRIGEIEDALVRIGKDSKLRKTLVERGERRIRDFDWEKMARETLDVYRLAAER